jgi:hypothetical protein
MPGLAPAGFEAVIAEAAVDQLEPAVNDRQATQSAPDVLDLPA